MKDAELSPSDRIFVDILYSTGLRCGEALALTRFDIDFVEKTINVNKAVEFDEAGRPSIKDPKSKTASGRCRSRQALRVAGKLRSVLHQRDIAICYAGRQNGF